jgi:diguanylate cyclase (GGDEF)-like protein
MLAGLIVLAGVSQAAAERVGGTAAHWVGNAGTTAAMVFFLGVCLHTAGRMRGRLRLAWGGFAGGATLLLAGQIAWDAHVLEGTLPSPPSLYDAGMLAAAPLFVGGFLATARGDRLTRSLATFDLGVLACALGMLFTTLFWAALQHSPLSPSGRITILLYPICYSTLGGALVLVPMRRTWGRVSYSFLFLGLLAQIIPVCAATPTFLARGYSDNLPAEVLGTVSILLVSASALTFEAVPPSDTETLVMGHTAWASLVLSVVAMAVAVWGFHASTLQASSLAGLSIMRVGMVTFTAIRLVMTLRHSRTLVRTAREAAETLRASEERYAHQARHDALTGLPNRAFLRQRLDAVLPAEASAALLLMDLDGFKEINDTFGHHYGDVLLECVGPRLMGAVRPSDTVARLGGDEFAVLLPDIDAAGARAVAARILACFEQPFLLEHQPILVGASLGIALYPEHGADAHELMRRADVAMYAAKRSGQRAATYDPEDDQHSPQRLALLGELREAIEQGQLTLHYQPQLDLRSGCIRHVEALARWQHPQRGMILPDQFIPLAEHSGLIAPLARWVLGEAIRQCGEWHGEGCRVSVAVNLSARNLHDPGLVPVIDELLDRWQVPARYLRMEITESTIMFGSEQARRALTQLHERGITIGIDDFGTGYSSLAYLRRLPVGQVKIDQTFVRTMATHEEDVFVVQTIVSLGKNLGLEVVAEGVEDERTLELLRRMQCDLAQGYFLTQPLPAGDVVAWIEAYARRIHAPSPHLSLIKTAQG